MRLYRVVMCSGASLDIMAKVVVDDPAASDSINFYQDETQHHMVATVKRNQVAGLIQFPQKSSTMALHR